MNEHGFDGHQCLPVFVDDLDMSLARPFWSRGYDAWTRDYWRYVWPFVGPFVGPVPVKRSARR